MKPETEKTPKVEAVLLRIGGTNTQVVQFMDYPDFSDPNGRHILVVSFGKATLSDANGNDIYTGQIIVRVNTILTPASLAMITQLLQPFKGFFVMIVKGRYDPPSSYVEVYAEDVPWTNIQPDLTEFKGEVHLVPAQPL